MKNLTQQEKEILNVLQDDLPLVERPFQVLAERLNMSEDEFLCRVNDLKKRGYIRRVGSFLNSRALGYRGSLVGLEVDKKNLPDVAKVINAFNGVTHNYERDGKLNLWFTLQTQNDLEKEKILETVRSCEGVQRLFELPAKKIYKVRVNFHV